jgi:HSP20 family molecular chaperone IbpA
VFDLDGVKAVFSDGILELTIPRKEKQLPSKRTISIG